MAQAAELLQNSEDKNMRNFISSPMHGEKKTDTRAAAAAIVPEEMEGSSS
jgi:hypothetical protein